MDQEEQKTEEMTRYLNGLKRYTGKKGSRSTWMESFPVRERWEKLFEVRGGRECSTWGLCAGRREVD